MEGKEWVWNNGSLVEIELERAKQRINERVRKRQENENTRVYKVSQKVIIYK